MIRLPPGPLLAAFLLLFAPLALAWNAAGHRLVAAIAWQQLGPPARLEAARLLALHPDAASWEKRRRGEPALGLFVEASTWADDIRRDPRFHDPGREAATPGRDGYPDMARRRDWHFLNLPLGAAAGSRPPAGELDRAIASLAAQVGDPRLADATRSYALAWLIHLVGDIHQPLHVVSRIDASGDDDGGGNGLLVLDPANARHPESNLHAWWDDLPGPPWLRDPRLAAAAAALVERHPAATVAQGDVALWRDESYALAATTVYPDAGASGARLILGDDYRQTARAIAEARLAAAGHRLGRLLDRLLTRRGRP